jgi:hypothetical protein
MEKQVNTNASFNPEIENQLLDITFSEPIGSGYGDIHAPEISVDQASSLAENMRGYFETVPEGTPGGCIDGRHSVELLNNEQLVEPRPGVAGGAGVTAMGMAELEGYFGESNMSPAERFSTLVERLELEVPGKKVIKAGGHLDEDAVENSFIEGKTGCGAADKLVANLTLLSKANITFTNSEGIQLTETDEDVRIRIRTVKQLTAAVVQESGYYDYDNFSSVVEGIVLAATEITQQKKLDGWNGVIMKKDLADRGGDRLVVLDTKAGGVHGHTEKAVLFNFKDRSTFNQDKFFDHTLESDGVGSEIFDVDVWYIRDIADVLANSPDEQQAGRLFASGVAFQIATYLGLCDGSHRAFFIK